MKRVSTLEQPIQDQTIGGTLGNLAPAPRPTEALAEPPGTVSRWLGPVFILGGLLLAALITTEVLMHQGQRLPSWVFSSFRRLGPLAFAGATVVGLLSRSRLARVLSLSSIAYMALFSATQHYQLPIDWTAPRALLSGALIVGGIVLWQKRSSS